MAADTEHVAPGHDVRTGGFAFQPISPTLMAGFRRPTHAAGLMRPTAEPEVQIRCLDDCDIALGMSTDEGGAAS